VGCGGAYPGRLCPPGALATKTFTNVDDCPEMSSRTYIHPAVVKGLLVAYERKKLSLLSNSQCFTLTCKKGAILNFNPTKIMSLQGFGTGHFRIPGPLVLIAQYWLNKDMAPLKVERKGVFYKISILGNEKKVITFYPLACKINTGAGRLRCVWGINHCSAHPSVL